MDTNPQRQERRENTLSVLNVTIDALNLAKEISSATPAKAVFGSVGALLSMIKVRPFLVSDDTSQVHVQLGLHGQRTEYVELGLACADVCRALERGMGGKQLEDLS